MTTIITDERIIFLDLDGMAVDLEARIIQKHNDRNGTNYTKKDVVYDEDGEGSLPDIERKPAVLANWLDHNGMFRDLSPLDGAVEAIEDLKQIGSVYIASSPSRNDDSASDKVRWVREYLNIDRKKICLLKAKWLLRGDAFFEDWPNNLIKFRKTNPTAFLGTIAYPHNERVKDIVNVRAHDFLNTRQAWGSLVRGVEEFFRTRA